MEEIFKQRFHIRWADMDFNAHMRNTAYLDMAGDIRMMYFKQHGFPTREFERLNIGPVVMKDEIEYYRELKLLEHVNVTLEMAGLAQDGSRFKICNQFYRVDGKKAAKVTSTGGWLNLEQRCLIIPPPDLADILSAITQIQGFETLPSSIKV